MENNIKEITKNLSEMLNYATDMILKKQNEMETPEQKKEFLEALKSSDIVNKLEEVKKQFKNI
jgi:hypothetical protein